MINILLTIFFFLFIGCVRFLTRFRGLLMSIGVKSTLGLAGILFVIALFIAVVVRFGRGFLFHIDVFRGMIDKNMPKGKLNKNRSNRAITANYA